MSDTSAFFPHSNARAEIAVRQAKRMIRENTDKSGNLDNDKFARALLNYRNTPLKDIGLSPAQIIFARNIKDHMPIYPGNYKPRQEWILTQERREELLAKRYELMGDRLRLGTKALGKLNLGNIVSLQNQAGPRAKKWDRTGVVVEVLPYDQYRVKVDGSGRVSLRNRQFLRKLGEGDSSAGTCPPTQPVPVDTLHQVGAGHGGGVIGETKPSLSQDHMEQQSAVPVQASYADAVKSHI